MLDEWFCGILVVLSIFENNQKSKCETFITPFDSSLVVYDKGRHVCKYAFTCLMNDFGDILVVWSLLKTNEKWDMKYIYHHSLVV